jgi:hypothetical protein
VNKIDVAPRETRKLLGAHPLAGEQAVGEPTEQRHVGAREQRSIRLRDAPAAAVVCSRRRDGVFEVEEARNVR